MSRFDVYGDVVAAYGRNECAVCCGGAFNCFCCNRPLWSGDTSCGGDGQAFTADWNVHSRALRIKFEHELNGSCEDALRAAPPPACCWDPNVGAIVEHLNATWCPRVNAELLQHAGYECIVHYWITKTVSTNEQGQRQESTQHHMAVVVVKGPLTPLPPPPPAPPTPRERFAEFGDVQGAYGHHLCDMCCCGPFLWRLFCCCVPRKLWNADSHCDGDGIEFAEKRVFSGEDWGGTAQQSAEAIALRLRFEQELMGRDMRDALRHAPGRGCGPCCFGCSDMGAQVRHLNATWVARVNAELLAPAGYACVAHFWYQPVRISAEPP